MYYREVCTGAEQNKAVLYYSMWCTDITLCHTKYAQSLFSEVDYCDVTSLGMPRAFPCTEYVRSTY
jgi:hypothetical protein